MGEFRSDTRYYDRNDHPGGLTTMISNFHLPLVYQPGRFHLFSFGLFVKLNRLRAITFSGLRKHGGTPPIAPPDQPVDHWAYRLMFVLYPPKAMLDAAGRTMIGLATNIPGDLLCATPEMTTLMYVSITADFWC